ncbi:Ger(x)C family spore germination protein [Lysinibacillus sp. BW-2-10]|nr:Ger(x)C family spore germination protein [Lysinibacillus sp. BW-2-10]
MRFIQFIIIIVLLTGCWDERLYKEHSVVSLAGMEGTLGDMKGIYAYSEALQDSTEITVIEAEGKSPREVRLNAEMKVEQSIDLSMLSAFILGEDLATDGLEKYLDVFYRDPYNSLTAFVVIAKGSVKDYIDASKSWSAEAGEYYSRLIRSAEILSYVPEYTLQTTGATLNSKGTDLVLPYITLDEKQQRPQLAGVALFSKGKYTGRVLKPDQSKVIGLLLQKKGRKIQFSFFYNNKPLSITVMDVKKKWKVTSSNSIKLDYDLQMDIQELSGDNLTDTKEIPEIEKFLEQKITEEIEKVITVLQEEKSDVLGVGNFVRVAKPEMFDENWHETFAELDIAVNVKGKILKVGIIK